MKMHAFETIAGPLKVKYSFCCLSNKIINPQNKREMAKINLYLDIYYIDFKAFISRKKILKMCFSIPEL